MYIMRSYIEISIFTLSHYHKTVISVIIALNEAQKIMLVPIVEE